MRSPKYCKSKAENAQLVRWILIESVCRLPISDPFLRLDRLQVRPAVDVERRAQHRVDKQEICDVPLRNQSGRQLWAQHIHGQCTAKRGEGETFLVISDGDQTELYHAFSSFLD